MAQSYLGADGGFNMPLRAGLKPSQSGPVMVESVENSGASEAGKNFVLRQ